MRTENRPMTIDEVRYKCFSNYNRYGIKKDDFVGSKSASVIIYECLYQHSDYNHNHNAAKQYKFFTCDVDGGHSRNNRYAFRQGLILW